MKISIKKIVKSIFNHCEECNCNGCPIDNYDGGCLLRHDDFPRGLTKEYIPEFFYPPAQADVLNVINGKKGSSILNTKKGVYTKRHSKAIDELKEAGIIAKDSANILYII